MQADIFSVGCLIYYLVSLAKSKNPYLLSQHDTTNKQLHVNECMQIQQKLNREITDFDQNLQAILRQMVSENPQFRGQLGTYVQN